MFAVVAAALLFVFDFMRQIAFAPAQAEECSCLSSASVSAVRRRGDWQEQRLISLILIGHDLRRLQNIYRAKEEDRERSASGKGCAVPNVRQT